MKSDRQRPRNLIAIWKLYVCALTGVLVLSVASCGTHSKVGNGSEATQVIDDPDESKEALPQTISVNFKGISVQSNVPLTDGIKTSEEPAVFLEEETDKPDSVAPRHIDLRFEGPYQERQEDSFFEPSIKVFPVTEFRTALAKSASYVRQFDDQLLLLKRIVDGKTALTVGRAPHIPFYDGSPEIITHIKNLSFKNGRGVLYVAHFSIEPTIVNNNGLTCVFQGLTSDNKYYVMATLPVRLAFLPDSYVDSFGDYELPMYFFDQKSKRENEKRYLEYLTGIAVRISKVDPNEFSPTLDTVGDTISSLEVNWKD